MSYFEKMRIQKADGTVIDPAKEDGNLATVAADTTSLDGKVTKCDTDDVAVNNFPTEYPLPAAQVSTLTPPAAITNFAEETGGNLEDIKTNTDKLDILLSALRDAITAASPNNKTLKDLYDKLDVLDNFISGSKGLVTEDNSAAIKTAVEALQSTDGIKKITDTVTVQGTVTASGPLTDTQLRAADVKITLDGESVGVTGTFWQATQPISGTVTIQDGGNSITVDAPVGTPVFVRMSDGASALTPANVFDLDSGAGTDYALGVSLRYTGAGGSVPLGDATTPMQVSLANHAANAVAVKVNIASGGIASGAVASGAIASGAVALGAIAAGANSIVKAEDVAHVTGDYGVAVFAVRDDTCEARSGTENDYEPLHTDAVGRLWVNPQGNVAHDDVDALNPIKIGGRAVSALAGVTQVAANDRIDFIGDTDAVQVVKSYVPYGTILSERVSNTDGNSTAFSTFGATASQRNYITTITVTNVHASTNGYVDIRDGTAGAVLWTIALKAGESHTVTFNPPLRQPTANTALAFDVSAAITTVYIAVCGFKSGA